MRGFPWRAVALSLILHALLLAAWEPTEPAVEALGADMRLEGVLLPRAARAPAAVPLNPAPAAAPAAQRAVPPAPTFAKPVAPPAVAAVVAVPATAAASPAMAAAPGANAIPPAPASVGSDSPAPAGTAEPAAQSPAPATRGPDAAGLRQYRLALAGEARRFRRYPEAARRDGLAGTAEISIAVTDGGRTRRTELSRSSGHAQLDAAALEMMQRAAERTALPDALRGQEFVVRLPVVFAVEE